MVPETLLKKRKSQEKERAEKQQDRDAKKKVCSFALPTHPSVMDIYPVLTSLVRCCQQFTIFRV